MQSHCQDDSFVKRTGHLAVDTQLYVHGRHSNRSAPNLLTEQGSLPESAHSSHGFRIQLHHLLPRHAYFRARIQIHQISNIPLVSGRFNVRWKLKNVHSPPGAKYGFLGIVKGRSRPSTPMSQTEFKIPDKSKSKQDATKTVADNPSPTTPEDHPVPSVVISSYPQGRSSLDHPTRPSILHSHARPSTSSGSSLASGSNAAFPIPPFHDKSSFNCQNQPISPAQSPSFRTFSLPDVPTARSVPPKSAALLTPKPEPMTPRDSAARGQTAVVDLKDHSVIWQHTVTTVLRLDISRDSGLLAPSPLKLVVVQHPTRNDPSPQNPRLGAVYFNMAEYVDKGLVQRKYLLKESKINAILKLSIELEHIGGSTDYKAPPLPKGEIMNGVTSLLERDIYYGENNSFHKEVYQPRRQMSQGSKSSDLSLDSRKCDMSSSIDFRPPFDVEGLQGADGATDTQSLIDALFNPAITTEKEKESPFTLYVSSHGEHGQGRLDANPKRNVQNLEAASMYSTASSSEDAVWTMGRTVSSSSSVAPSVASSSKSAKARALHLPLTTDLHPAEIEPAPISARSIKGWFRNRTISRPAHA